jgi:hypothetical protein
MSDHRDQALARAARVYGDKLRVEPRRYTATTLQGRTERGYLVWGRAHGGDWLGCIFPSMDSARAAIAKALGTE